MTDTTDLTAALAGLGRLRRPFLAAISEQRDRSTAAGDHELARVFNELLCTVAEIEDEQQRMSRALDRLWLLPSAADRYEPDYSPDTDPDAEAQTPTEGEEP